jgi:hypothetical protein
VVVSGTATISHDAQSTKLRAGQTWPLQYAPIFAGSNQRVVVAIQKVDQLEFDRPPVKEPANTAAPEMEQTERTLGSGPVPEPGRTMPPPVRVVETSSDDKSQTTKDHWRLARLRRSQGNFVEALSECDIVVQSKDPVWAPIALIEQARIHLGPLTNPEQAIAAAQQFEATFSKHPLAPEAREIRCRALQQLGRPQECMKQK